MTVFLVSIDGPDLSGKSTVVNLLIEHLRVLCPDKIIQKTELPSDLITGFFPKSLRNSADKPDAHTLALAYATDHLHHYKTIIEPLEKSDKDYLVVQSRSLLATVVYQSILGEVDLKWMLEINKHDKNIPDLQIVLLLDINEILKRKKFMQKDGDIYETTEHIKKQLETYSNLPLELTEKFNIIKYETNKESAQIAKELAELIKSKVEAKITQQQLAE